MKKFNILAVSLVAVMTAGAANAKIASTEYVDTATGDLKTLTTTAQNNLVGAINELDTAAKGVAGSIATAKQEAIDAAATDAANKVKTLADGAVKTNTDAIGVLNGTGDGSVTKKIADATSNMQVTTNMATAASAVAGDKGSTTKYTSVAAAEAIAAAAADAVAGDLTTLTGRVTSAEGDIDDLEATVNGAEATEGSMKYLIKEAKDSAISTAAADATTKANAAQSAAEAKVAELANGAVKTNTTNIATNTSAITALQSGKQDKLNNTNLTGSNGVTVAIADDGKISITGNGAAVEGLTDRVDTAEGKIDALEQTGVTAEKIAQIATNTTNIGTNTANIKTVTDKVNDATNGLDSKLATATYNAEVGAVSATNMGTTAGTVVGAIKEVATTANAAIPQPGAADKCTTEEDGCALLYKGGKYIWESVGR